MLPAGSVGAEIGVHLGEFSAAILETVAPRELHLIDPWQHESSPEYEQAWYGGQARDGQREMDERYESVCARFADQVRSGQVTVHRAPSDQVLDAFADGHFDWVYIDGNHLYEYVTKDIALAYRKTRVGGFITGDDYSPGGWWQGGVKRAVDEFATEDGVQLVLVQNGQYVFKKLEPVRDL
jgi:hypothetical protein